MNEQWDTTPNQVIKDYFQGKMLVEVDGHVMDEDGEPLDLPQKIINAEISLDEEVESGIHLYLRTQTVHIRPDDDIKVEET